MTETEAKKKWCPMVRRVDTVAPVNRKYDGAPTNGSSCLGSDCMMWRSNRVVTEQPYPNPTIVKEVGFCGLAGQP